MLFPMKWRGAYLLHDNSYNLGGQEVDGIKINVRLPEYTMNHVIYLIRADFIPFDNYGKSKSYMP